jgi:hypothetical protein
MVLWGRSLTVPYKNSGENMKKRWFVWCGNGGFRVDGYARAERLVVEGSTTTYADSLSARRKSIWKAFRRGYHDPRRRVSVGLTSLIEKNMSNSEFFPSYQG